MRTIRAYTDAPLVLGQVVRLDPIASQHLARVLRLPMDAPVRIFNGDGCDYAGHIVGLKRDAVEVRLATREPAAPESPLRLTLAQCVARAEKMDWVVQKATELGVARIVPVVSERTEVRLEPDRAERRRAHWHGVAVAACEQCGRARVPEVAPLVELADFLAEPRGDGEQALVLDPDGTAGLGAVASSAYCLLVGPEGGFSEREIAAATHAGFLPARLGPRVLRSETAGAAALAVLGARLGDL